MQSMQENYELLNGKCYSNNLNLNQCLVENCKYCEDSQCMVCSTNYVLNPFDNFCQPICGDGIILEGELCDDGNSINGDGCDTNCKPSSDSLCVNSQCIYVSHPKPLLKFVKEMDNSQIVYLTYDQQIKLSFNYSIQMFINSISSKINNKVVNVSFSEIGSIDQESCKYFQMEIKILYEEIIIDPIFSISFADLNIITNEFGKISYEDEISIQLPSPNVLSEKQQQITQSLIKFSGYQIKIIAGLILLSSLSGKFEIIQNQIDVIQQLYYLKYINSRKGQNLIQYFETFKIIQLTSFYDFVGFNPSNNAFLDSHIKNQKRALKKMGVMQTISLISSRFLQFCFSLFSSFSNQDTNQIHHEQNQDVENSVFQFIHIIWNKNVTKFSINNWKNKFSEQFQGLLQALLYEYTISSFLSLIYQDFNQVEGKFGLIVNGVVIYLLLYYLLYQKHQNNKLHAQFTYSSLQKMLFGTILIVCFKSTILQIQLCALNEFIYFYHLFKQKQQFDKFGLFKNNRLILIYLSQISCF